MNKDELPSGKEKTVAVQAMFDRIANRYDAVNKVMTFGLDNLWRRSSMSLLSLPPGSTVLDIACGTGDYCRLLTKAGHNPIGVDLSYGMLANARTVAPLVQADATNLPFANNSVDGIVSGFSLRNITELNRFFEEMARVLRPGGRMVLLDAHQPDSTPLRIGHGFYFGKVVPRIGGLLSDKVAYSYLPASLAYMPPPSRICVDIETAGFKDVLRRTYLGGTCHAFCATRS